MSDLILGQAICPHCQAPIVVMGDEYGRQTPVETDQYLVVFDRKPPSPRSRNRLSAFDIRTGVLVYGRRATAKERKAYQRSGTIGHPFAIGAIGHLSRCPKWDGKPFRMHPESFIGQAWTERHPAPRVAQEGIGWPQDHPGKQQKQEEMGYE